MQVARERGARATARRGGGRRFLGGLAHRRRSRAAPAARLEFDGDAPPHRPSNNRLQRAARQRNRSRDYGNARTRAENLERSPRRRCPSHGRRPPCGTWREQSADAAEEKLESMWAKGGFSVTVVVRQGDPRHLLIDEANAVGARLIVVGAGRGESRPPHPRGLVAVRAVPHAPCEVLVERSPSLHAA